MITTVGPQLSNSPKLLGLMRLLPISKVEQCIPITANGNTFHNSEPANYRKLASNNLERD